MSYHCLLCTVPNLILSISLTQFFSFLTFILIISLCDPPLCLMLDHRCSSFLFLSPLTYFVLSSFLPFLTLHPLLSLLSPPTSSTIFLLFFPSIFHLIFLFLSLSLSPYLSLSLSLSISLSLPLNLPLTPSLSLSLSLSISLSP